VSEPFMCAVMFFIATFTYAANCIFVHHYTDRTKIMPPHRKSCYYDEYITFRES